MRIPQVRERLLDIAMRLRADKPDESDELLTLHGELFRREPIMRTCKRPRLSPEEATELHEAIRQVHESEPDLTQMEIAIKLDTTPGRVSVALAGERE